MNTRIKKISSWLDNHQKIKQWLWFFALWFLGLFALISFAYPVRWIMKNLMK